MKNTKKYVDLDNTREESQKQIMQEIDEKGHCPFCLENFKNYHQKPFLKEDKYWLATMNRWPYKNTRDHFLMVSKRHIETPQEMTDQEAVSFFKLANWLIKKYKIPGGGLVMRFGDTGFSAGSIRHLHAQLIVPDADKEGFESVKVSLGKSHSKRYKKT